MRAQSAKTRVRILVCCFVATLVMLGTWRSRIAWAGTLAKPQRQTVPLTPPPTWTPVPPPVTPAPTRPARVPPRPATPSAGAEPWLDLSVVPSIVAPGSRVTCTVQLANVGGSAMNDARVTLELPPWLVLGDLRATTGSVRVDGLELGWLPDPVGAGDALTFEAHLVVSEDAPPATSALLEALLTWAGGSDRSNQEELELPPVLLPETGG